MMLLPIAVVFVIVLTATDSKPFNILFVVSDDLRADLGGYYGENDILYTPNLDAFQNRAFTFTHAYTQQAVCNPTRSSFLTGTRPDTTRVWNNPYTKNGTSHPVYFRDRMINNTGKTVITIPQYFKDYGNYYVVGSGKIFHPEGGSGGTGKCNFGDDQPYSWTSYWDCVGSVADAEVASPAQHQCVNGTGCTQTQTCLQCLSDWNCYNFNGTKWQKLVCPADCNDDCFQDYDVAHQTLHYFKQVTTDEKLKDKPFFIAAGLRRPHVGFFAPLKYFEQYGYNNNYTNIPIAKHTSPPYNMPIKAATNCSGDVCAWNDIKPYVLKKEYLNPVDGKNYTLKYVNTSIHDAVRAGYYASVSFMDSQFGRIIQGLYEYNLWNNTIVSFVGDHGWHLGEQGFWAKYTNFEIATRVPLMIRVPGLNEGQKSDVLVEQLDIFPTLIDASGVGFNDTSNITKQLEGKSLLNLIQDPSKFIDYYAYSQYPRGGAAPNPNVMGLSIRTTQWRYTEWLQFNPGTNTSSPYPIWNVSYGLELYNHSNLTVDENDMNGYDNYNLAYDDDMQSIVNKLHDELYKTWDNQSWAINHKYR